MKKLRAADILRSYEDDMLKYAERKDESVIRECFQSITELPLDGNAKSDKTILKHSEKYHVDRLIKLGDYNVGGSEQTLTLPLYMTFLLIDN